MTGSEADLAELRWHWGSAYLVHHFAEAGRWVARRRDSHATVSADDPGQLLSLIRADYAAYPVPRGEYCRGDGMGECCVPARR
jgi:hypothetical protein